MDKPKDPRLHGLVKPIKTLAKSFHVEFGTGSSASLNELNVARTKVFDLRDQFLKDEKLDLSFNSVSEGFSQARFGVAFEYYFIISYENKNYQAQLDTYLDTITKYEADLLAYENHKKNKALQKQEDKAQSLDDRIKRAEQRLANLKAEKEGKPIPFPSSETNQSEQNQPEEICYCMRTPCHHFR